MQRYARGEHDVWFLLVLSASTVRTMSNASMCHMFVIKTLNGAKGAFTRQPPTAHKISSDWPVTTLCVFGRSTLSVLSFHISPVGSRCYRRQHLSKAATTTTTTVAHNIMNVLSCWREYAVLSGRQSYFSSFLSFICSCAKLCGRMKTSQFRKKEKNGWPWLDAGIRPPHTHTLRFAKKLKSLWKKRRLPFEMAKQTRSIRSVCAMCVCTVYVWIDFNRYNMHKRFCREKTKFNFNA